MMQKNLPTGIILFLFIGILLIMVSPEDKELGSLLKLIYLHGALINTALFLFSAAGLISIISFFRVSKFYLLHAVEKTAIVFWIAATIVGNITSHLAWGGIFFGEPRFNVTIIVTLISISVYFISTAAENARVQSFLGIVLALSVWVLMINTGRIVHPDNPFGISESSIRFFFGIITLVFLITSIQTVRWVAKNN